MRSRRIFLAAAMRHTGLDPAVSDPAAKSR